MADTVNIDSLSLEISASTQGADESLTKLASSLTKLKTSLDGIGKNVKDLQNLTASLQTMAGLDSTKIASMAKSLRVIGTVQPNSRSISDITKSMGDLVKTVNKVNPTKINDLSSSLASLTTISGASQSMTSFVQSMNQFVSSSTKIKKTAAEFPALAKELRAFFDSMQNVTIADNTVRMAEALAQIAKSGKNASTAMKTVSASTGQTAKQFNYASIVGRGLNKVLDSIINALKKIGGGALNGIKTLATNLSNIGRSSSGVNSLTSNIKTLLGTMIGFRGIVGVFNWSKQMMKMGADVTEIDHIVKSVFGEDMVGYVNDWANDTMEKFGIASTAAKQYAGTMSAMFQASNVSVKDSNQMATDLVGLAGDLSAFYNIDTETAYNKIKSGMAGMVRPLRKQNCAHVQKCA